MCMKRGLLSVLCFVIVFSFHYGVSIPFWEIQWKEGIGPTSMGAGSIWGNPSLLVHTDKWTVGGVTLSSFEGEDEGYVLFGVHVIQPYQYGFAGSMDLSYGKLLDWDGNNDFASFGYSVAGKHESLAWGVRLSTGFFYDANDPATNAFYGSANFGISYSVLPYTHFVLNFNAPQVVTTVPQIYAVNAPESFWVGGGIINRTSLGRAYIGAASYSRNENLFMSFHFGGGFKVGFLEWDAAIILKDLYQNIPMETIPCSIKVSGSLDFETFSLGVGTEIPFFQEQTSTRWQLFVQLRW